MSSREQILANIRKLNLEVSPLPEIPEFDFAQDIKTAFIKAAEANHVNIIDQPESLQAALNQVIFPYHAIYDCTETIPSSVDEIWLNDREKLPTLEAVVVHGNIGVAENAAIWIPEQNVQQRILTFVTLHYVVILKTSDLVANMHQAYAKIDEIPGFGVFVAGPSKTADIEQSLVIGAHGPKKMTVILV